MHFPPDIDLCRSGYSRNLKGEHPTQTFDAWQRQRRMVRRRGVTDTLSWIVSRTQCGQLEQFHRHASGQWFEIDLPAYDGLTTTVVRFDGPLAIKPVRDLFEVSASVFVPHPAVMPPDDLDSALLEGIGVTGPEFGNSLHAWVNYGWGVFWNTGIRDDRFYWPLHQFVNEQWPLAYRSKR